MNILLELMICIEILYTAVLLLRHRRREKTEYSAAPRRFVLWVGLTGQIFFLAVAAVALHVSRPLMGWTLYALSLLGLYNVMGYLRWRVDYDDSGFTFTNLLGRTQRAEYRELRSLKPGGTGEILCAGSFRVILNPKDPQEAAFLDTVREKYRELHEGQEIPLPASPGRFDLFRGHVTCPGAYTFILAVVLTGSLIVTVMGVRDISSRLEGPMTMEELELVKGPILSPEERGGLRTMTVDGRQLYVLTAWLEEPEQLAELCEQGRSVTVGYDPREPAMDPDTGECCVYRAMSIRDDRCRLLLSPERIYSLREPLAAGDFVIFLFPLLGLSFCGVILYSLRNPDRVPEKLLRQIINPKHLRK